MKIHTPHITANNTSVIPDHTRIIEIPDHARTIRKPRLGKGIKTVIVEAPPGADPSLNIHEGSNILAYEPTVEVTPDGFQRRTVWIETEEEAHSASPEVRVKHDKYRSRYAWAEVDQRSASPDNQSQPQPTEQATLPEALIAIRNRIEEADETANRDKDTAEMKVSVVRHFFPSAFGG